MTAALRKAAERARRKDRGEVALSVWLSAKDAATLKEMAKDAGITQGEVVKQLIAYYWS